MFCNVKIRRQAYGLINAETAIVVYFVLQFILIIEIITIVESKIMSISNLMQLNKL
jgi:hypothetical protein